MGTFVERLFFYCFDISYYVQGRGVCEADERAAQQADHEQGERRRRAARLLLRGRQQGRL